MHAVSLAVTGVERADRTLDARDALVFHISGGRVAEAWVLYEDQYSV